MKRRVRHFLRKCKGPETGRPRALPDGVLWSFLGGCIGIIALTWLSRATGNPLLIAPFGATCVLLFAVPDSPLAQPRAVIGGHLVASLVALAVLAACGDEWWTGGLAVGSAIGAMQLTRTVHPPAGADPIVIVLAKADWVFALNPVLLGALLLVVLALFFNNLARSRRYPRYWY